ncbi:hypothetical protein [Natrinema caseinilyticum]|uniref:hypothetical protein n=1 Tax=Natrinema caseinilyticum TaxID=2961570 RepID=UPI0020C1C709|nr:hypothetical protein [Natrinema caseinilyticum]
MLDPNDHPDAEAAYVITDPDFPTDDELEDRTPDEGRERLLRFIGRGAWTITGRSTRR